MKKSLYIIAAFVLASVSSCTMFKYDVMDGPNAQVTGKILDVKTGQKVGVEAEHDMTFSWTTWSYVATAPDMGSLVVVEQGWDAQADQDWLVRFDGQYTNNLIFAGDYVFSTKKLPCYEPENTAFTIKEGKNKMDIGVLPFCRIVDPEFKLVDGNIEASFSVELGDPAAANKIPNVALCANTTLFVGCNYFNLAKGNAAKAKDVNPGERITLTIDAKDSANEDLFGKNKNTGAAYVQDRYVRIAAMANGNGYNTNNLYNFSATYKIAADFSKYEEVVWEENEW